MSENTVQARLGGLYFVNRWVDWLAIGGLSIIAWALLRSLHDGARSDTVIALGMQLAWFVNWPHFSATSSRLYQSSAHIAQYPKTAKLLPFLIIAGVGAAIAAPEEIAPWWVKLFLIWSPYHFSGQSFGISMLYARRGGWRPSARLRLGLRLFIYSTFLIGTLRAETWEGAGDWYGVSVPYLGLPEWSVTFSESLLYIGLTLCLVELLSGWQRTKSWPPLICALPPLAQYLWFIHGAGWASFSEFVPLFHSLQYLLIAWSLQLNHRHLQSGARGGRFIWRESLRWGGINFLGGALLFFGIPHLVAHWAETSVFFATAVVIAGVQLHHFIVDGVIWRLRRESVRSPLMGELNALL